MNPQANQSKPLAWQSHLEATSIAFSPPQFL